MRKTVLLFMAALILRLGTTGVTQEAGPTLKKITAFDLPGLSEMPLLNFGAAFTYVAAHRAKSKSILPGANVHDRANTG
jgi:hypothetical protein